jgi:hypothetical protein
VTNTKNPISGRITTIITSDFELLGGVIKGKTLHLKSIRLPDVPEGYIILQEMIGSVIVETNQILATNIVDSTINHDTNNVADILNNENNDLLTNSKELKLLDTELEVLVDANNDNDVNISPMTTTRRLPVANLFQVQQSQHVIACTVHGMNWLE